MGKTIRLVKIDKKSEIRGKIIGVKERKNDLSFSYKIICSYTDNQLENLIKDNILSPQNKRIIKAELKRRRNSNKKIVK